jgi:hypothetical protein
MYLHKTGSTLEFAGANVMRSGNIVIHTKAPHTASEVLQIIHLNNSVNVTLAGKDMPSFSCPDFPPEVELDIPWHSIVIHDIPTQPLLESYRGAEDALRLWDAVLEQTGLPERAVRDLQILCQDDDMEEKEHLSFKIMLDDP